MVDASLVDGARGEVLRELSEELEPVAALVRDALERGDNAARDELAGRFDRTAGSLTLLERPALALVAQEAARVVDGLIRNTLVERQATGPQDVAHALLGARQVLMDTLDDIACARRPGDIIDSALPALVVLNRLRVLRGGALLSQALLIALDIPVGPPGAAAAGSDVHAFAAAVRKRRPRLMRCLIDWFRAVNAGDAARAGRCTARVADELELLLRQAGALVSHEQDLLLAATEVARATSRGQLSDDGALRRLFGQLERWMVKRWIKTDPAQEAEVADAQQLLRDLLFYVASRSDRPSPDPAARLIERYELVRVVALADAGAGADPVAASGSGRMAARGPGRRLRADVVARMQEDLRPFVDWLSQGGGKLDERAIAARLGRLRDLLPVFELLGASAAGARLAAALEQVDAAPQARLDEPQRLALAQRLLQLDEALGAFVHARPGTGEPRSFAALPAAETSAGTPLAERLARVGHVGRSDDSSVLEQSARDALVAAARHRLADCEQELESTFAQRPDSSSAGAAPSALARDGLASRIRSIARALDIVPRPEISALIDRLADIVGWMPAAPSAGISAALADFVVSIDACLASDARGSAAATLAPLDRAEQALAALDHRLPAGQLMAGLTPADAPGSPVAAGGARAASAPDPDGAPSSERALDAFAAIGTALDDEPADLLALRAGFAELRIVAREAQREDLERLGTAAGRRVEVVLAAAPRGADDASLAALRSAWMALPQLIAALGQPDSDPIDDLDQLLGDLEPNEAGDDPLDATLRDVFLTECAEHLDVLRGTLGSAASGPDQLPAEPLLRALHTLSGSARTASAHSIDEVVRPLQRAVLSVSEAGATLNAQAVRVLTEAIAVLEQRRGDFAEGRDSAPLRAGLLADIEGLARDPGQQRAATGPRATIAEVFNEEARELLDRLSAIARQPDPVPQALRVLHTLKGSASVAERPAIARRAHEAESALASVGEDAVPLIERTRRELDALLVGSPARQSEPPAASEPPAEPPAADTLTRVRERDWDRLMDLAQDIGASQARLAVELDRLQLASRELELAAQRFRRLPAAGSLLETEAARELMADLGSVRVGLRDALRAVDTEQRRGSRAGIALQQDLVRARLVRFDVARERLERTVADASRSAEKPVALRIDGGATTLDATLHARMLPALEHLLRNAVAHGIESAAGRGAAGKPPQGAITLTVAVEGTEIVVRLADDGGGIDRQQLAARLGRHVSTLQGNAALLDALADAGVTTQAVPTALAGHGLGLAAVRERLQELGGRLLLSDPGGRPSGGAASGGAQFELRIPQRIPVQPVVLVDAGELIALPVNCVAAVEAVSTDGQAPWLASLLGTGAAPDPGEDTDDWRELRLSPHGAFERVRVRAVIGYREIVVQALDAQLASTGRFTGVTALPDGRRAFVIDPATLASPRPRAASRKGTGMDRRPLALLADDSPTQRAWATATFEALGYRVLATRDGREALDALRHATPQVLLLDVDMPRIDGFGVLEALQEQGGAAFPVLVLTSRHSSRDRAAALAYGASGFLAKPGSRPRLKQALADAGAPLPLAEP